MPDRYEIFVADAFVHEGYAGNTAGVCMLDRWPDDQSLQALALRVGLAETAFIYSGKGKNEYQIRWFTPEIEMDLCGHATLAAAHVMYMSGYTSKEISFTSASGKLEVCRRNNMIVLNFPARMPVTTIAPEWITAGMREVPDEVYKSRDYMLVYDNERAIRNINPDRLILDKINLDPGGIIITAPGDTVDFVSRFFTPQASIFEDPVTGSAHCTLIPYWSRKLNKKKMIGCQLSERGGKLFCSDLGDRVEMGGFCTLQHKQPLIFMV